MRFALRAPAATGALALLATVLALPLAAPAHAAGETSRLWTLVDTNDDQSVGLAWTDVPGGALHVVEESASNDVSELVASTDGTRVAYVRDTPTREQLVVRDHSGQAVRTVADVSLDGDDLLSSPSLSPDGRTVAWTQVTLAATGFRTTVKRVAVAGGTPVSAYAGYGVLGFLGNGTLLLQGETANVGKSYTVALGSTTLKAVTGLPVNADQVAVSPDGTRIAWVQDTSASASVSTSVVRAGTLSVGGDGTHSVSGVTTLSRALDNEEPSFSRDGGTVYWVQYDGRTGPGQVLSQPFDAASGTAPTPVATSADASDDEYDVAVTGLPSEDTTPPTALAPMTAVLTGTTATLRWSLPEDASGAVVTRTGRSASVIGSSYTDSGLVLGQTYTYALTALDRAGNLAASSSTVQLQAMAAAPIAADPTSTTSVRTSFPVTFGPSLPSGASFTVEYLPAGTTTWKPWVQGAVRARTFGSAAAAGTLATTSVAGQTYSFRVRGTDAYGNPTPLVSTKAVVPFDQTKATYSGASTVASSASFLGSYRKLTSTRSYAKVTLTGNRFQVIGLRCSGCGSFAVYEGSTKVATVSSYATSTKARQVLFTRTWSTSATRTLTIKPLGTSGHPAVLLDGFAMRR